jgi:hypothetical protein
MSTFEPKLVIGCSSCITAEVERLSNLSLLLGWWGIPWGPIYTIRALAINSKAKVDAERAEPTRELCNYVAGNIGEIATDMVPH